MVSVYQTVDTGHSDIIHDAQMNYYGTTLATCSSDEAVRLFDVKDRKQKLIAELKGHQGPVWGLSWAHPIHGNLLASCSYDKTVIVWAEHEGKWEQFYKYTGHESSVNAVAWAPHEYGLVLACGSSDGSISILTYTSAGNWNAVRIPDAHTSGVNAISWAPAVNADFVLNPVLSQAAAGLVKRLVSGGCDSLLKIWREDPNSGNWVKEEGMQPAVGVTGASEGGHTDWVRDVAWCPSLSLARQQIASCGQDGRVIVWQSMRRLITAADAVAPANATADAGWKPVVLATYPDVVWHVSWSLTGNILAVSGGDNKVTLWKENLEGVWVILSEVSRGRQANLASSSSLGGTSGTGGYGLPPATTTTSAAGAGATEAPQPMTGIAGGLFGRMGMAPPPPPPTAQQQQQQMPTMMPQPQPTAAFYGHSNPATSAS